MDRVCVRPGCDRPARARLAYDTVTCQVWLDQLPERSGRSQEICDMHAERLTVPRGWMLCDRRAEAPALFVADVVAVAGDQVVAEGGAPRRRRSRRAPDTTRNLFDEIAADLSEAPIEVVVAPHLVVVDEVAVEVVDVAADVDEPEPEPVEEAAEPESVEEAAEPEATASGPAAPEAAEQDDQDDLPSLQATSPLLARAFRQTGPQRSVLTQSSSEADAD